MKDHSGTGRAALPPRDRAPLGRAPMLPIGRRGFAERAPPAEGLRRKLVEAEADGRGASSAEQARLWRAVLFGDLLGVALVSGAAIWSFAPAFA